MSDWQLETRLSDLEIILTREDDMLWSELRGLEATVDRLIDRIVELERRLDKHE